MADYTQAELDQAVESLIRRDVRFEYDSLGTRRLDVTFTDLQDAAAGVFTSNQAAPFYVVKLASNRLDALLVAEISSIDTLIDQVRACGRNVLPITKLSPLENARVALDALSNAAGNRDGGFEDIRQLPAFKRFKRNTARFLNDSGRNVKSGGFIVSTPQEARGKLKQLSMDLREKHEGVLGKAALIQGALSSYGSLQLPARQSYNIITNARDALQARLDELNALSDTERLSVIRDVVLDILAARAAVEGFGSLNPIGTFIVLDGEGGPFADASHPAVPAKLEADKYGPYSIYNTKHQLNVVVDGVTSLGLQPQGSFVPRLDVLRTTSDPYIIDASRNTWTMQLEGGGSGAVLITPGTHEVWKLVSELNGNFSTFPDPDVQGWKAELQFLPQKGSTVVNISEVIVPILPSVWKLEIMGGQEWDDFGVVMGDYILIKDSSSSADGTLLEVGNVPSATVVWCDVVYPSGSIPTETDIVVEFGSPTSLIYYLFLTTPELQQALDDREVYILSDLEADSLLSIGINTGTRLVARRTKASAVTDSLNISPTASSGGSAQARASHEFVVTVYLGKGRTEPSDPTKVVLYNFRGSATVESTGGGSTTFTVPGLQEDEIVVGETLVVRETPHEADVNLYGLVTSVVGTTVVADFDVSDALPTPIPYSVFLETGETIFVPSEPTLVIEEASVSDGVYDVDQVGATPLDLILVRPISDYLGEGGQPILLVSVRLGQYRSSFESLSTGLDSSVEVVSGDDDLSDTFFTALKKAWGTTVWFQLPEWPIDISVGDQLELYNNNYATPDFMATILSLEEDNKLIRISPEVPVNQAVLNFTVGTAVPFARIRRMQKNNYAELSEAVETWLALKNNDLLWYFRKLDAVLNPLVANTNPSLAQVNDAVLLLGELSATLTSLRTSLSTYDASVVPEVDTLLNSYQEEGADRASDVLASADFVTFFGLSMDESSYAGAVQVAIREVDRMDLPIRKDNRQTDEAVVQDTLIAQYDDVDFGFIAEEVNPQEDIDIPEYNDTLPGMVVP